MSRVYLVEDDQGVRRALARLLKAAGHEVSAHGDAGSFLQSLQGEAPACLVLDHNLPDSTGLELQRLLAERADCCGVVFITGRGDIPLSVRAMKSGAVDFLTKPIAENELLAAVDQALKRSARALQLRQLQRTRDELLSRLTPREREVCDEVARGRLNKQIAAMLGTAEKTVKVHRARVMEKLGVDSVADLVRLLERPEQPRTQRSEP